jgi:hypothetical protein
MTNENIIDDLTNWAQDFKEKNQAQLEEYERKTEEGEPIDQNRYKMVKAFAEMSLDDLRRSRRHHLRIKESNQATDEEFVEFSEKAGAISEQEARIIFSEREAEYIKHYQVNKEDPGMMFILKQIIKAELQIESLWQEIETAKLDVKNLADRDDIQKRHIDSITKLTKTIFDFTKYLQQWREEKSKREESDKEKKEFEKKSGLDFAMFKKKAENHPGLIKAKKAQKAKEAEYLEMIEGDNE